VKGARQGIESVTSAGLEPLYIAHIREFGVDIGYQADDVIAWTVIAPTNNVGTGSLAGDYGGASGSATVGVGVGANVLTGGFKESFGLQPAERRRQYRSQCCWRNRAAHIGIFARNKLKVDARAVGSGAMRCRTTPGTRGTHWLRAGAFSIFRVLIRRFPHRVDRT
jgi:Protein of unknown function (DUF992)